MEPLLAFVRRDRLDRDIDDELSFHLAMREADHRRAGVGEAEAARAARHQFGNRAVMKERARDAWAFPSFESLLRDVRFAGRTLRRSPGFTAIAVLTLAAGIGRRTFQPADTNADVVVGERLAQALWPGEDPIGHVFGFEKERFHVIGLVREIRYPSLDRGLDVPEFYERFEGVGSYAMLSIRCAPCPDAARVRQAISSATSAARAVSVGPLDEAYSAQLAQPRAAAALAFAFASIAALASAAGLFSVLSYTVGRRRREFGVRAALGASAGQIRALVLRDALIVVAIGMSIGGVGAWFLARGVSSLQYGVTLYDPLSWIVVLGVLGLTVLGASWRPAQQAAHVEPAALLRED